MQRNIAGWVLTLAALGVGIALVSWRVCRATTAPHTTAVGSPSSSSAPVDKPSSSPTHLAAPPLPALFPTKAGSYTVDAWRYDYSVTAPGSRSERRAGRLYKGGQEIIGTLGEVRDTPLGRFAFFGSNAWRYNLGWLNTLTYDQPVFGPEGEPLPTVRGYFAKPEDTESGVP
jgi:hypothetical protein